MPEVKRDLLIAFLRDSDARCPACRYSLRGCTSDRCPECGTLLSLQVGASRAGSGWWMAGVIGLSTCTTLILAILAILSLTITEELRQPHLRAQVRAGYASASNLAPWSVVVGVAMLLTVVVVAMGLFASRRPAFMAWPTWRRVCIGLLAAASPLIVIGVLALMVRVKT